jgi:hypothetical protein
MLLLSVSLLGFTPTKAETRYKTGFYLDRWKSDAGESGIQYHIPLEIASDTGDFSFKVLTAYAYNDVDSPTNEVKSFSGLVDTRVNLAYAFVDRWPVDVLVALDFSLPTGQTKLMASQAVSISDPDKVTITRMGEGLNINPNISLVKQWDALTAALGVGYLSRGKYDAADTLENYDPGDVLNFAARLDYRLSDQWQVRLFGSQTSFQKDRQNGSDYFEPGDVRIIGGGLTFTRSPWEVAGTYKIVLRDKNKLSDGSGLLISEDHDSFGDEKIAELNGRFQINAPTSVGLWLQYLTLAANDYPQSSSSYKSDRAKIAVGCELVRQLGARWEAGLRLKWFDMSVDNNPADVTDTDFHGDSLAMWIAARF